MSFPTGFSDAIASISGSGGGGGETEPDKWKTIAMNPFLDVEILKEDWERIGVLPTNQAYIKYGCLAGVRVTKVELPGSDFNLDADHPYVYLPDYFMYQAMQVTNRYAEVVPAEGVAYVLGDYSFRYAHLKTMPFKVASIGFRTFDECTFENGEFTLPSPTTGSTVILESQAFSGITSPGDITITVPDGYSLNSATVITPTKAWSLVMLATTPPNLHSSALGYTPKVASITVPKGSLEAYQSATNWAKFADIMVEAEE